MPNQRNSGDKILIRHPHPISLARGRMQRASDALPRLVPDGQSGSCDRRAPMVCAPHLMAEVRYVETNPVAARMERKLEPAKRGPKVRA